MLLKKTPKLVFSSKFFEDFENTFSLEHLQMKTSIFAFETNIFIQE